ncbi:MAG: serine hydrolase [Bacteroidia bacterium]|nr:serine hydrolase [Bacteroidia bacterium]
MKTSALWLALIALFFQPENLLATGYPIDGYETTGIRRLKRLELIITGEIKDTYPVSGAQKSICDISLNLLGERGATLDSLPAVDPQLQKALSAMFPYLNESYSITLLDITPGKPIRYAQRQQNRGFQPGSVGKLAVTAGFFTELAKIYPDSFHTRQALMRTKVVRAGKWAIPNEHTVPFFNPDTKKFFKRTLIEADTFSLYEWLDHMLSVSSNGAASVVWRETILMRVFGECYPELTEYEANDYFKNTPKDSLSRVANAVVNEPLRKLGITEDEWRLGKLFTNGAGTIVPGLGGSIGTPYGLMKFLVAMERGKIVDDSTSLEIKRLMYMTDRRIRYASSAALKDAAVYFKSGSLYKCKEEEGFKCGKYMGNVDNYMNSVAIVEHRDGTTYLVALMSNVLRKNSSSDHYALASRIDKLIRTAPTP